MIQTKEEFIEEWAKWHNTTVEQVYKTHVALHCFCECGDGVHWAMVPNDPIAIHDHVQFYGKTEK